MWRHFTGKKCQNWENLSHEILLLQKFSVIALKLNKVFEIWISHHLLLKITWGIKMGIGPIWESSSLTPLSSLDLSDFRFGLINIRPECCRFSFFSPPITCPKFMWQSFLNRIPSVLTAFIKLAGRQQRRSRQTQAFLYI